MSLDDYVEDSSEFNGTLEVGDVPSLKVNSPPGEFTTWSLYEPYQYNSEEDVKDVAVVGDCDIEGSEEEKMMVVGPVDATEDKMIKSDYYVELEDTEERSR